MNKYVKTEKHFYINIKYLLEVNRKAYRYVVQNFFTRIQPKVLNGERFINVKNILKFPTFLRKQLIEDFDKKGDKLSFENGDVVLKVKDKKIMDYDSKIKEETKEEVKEEVKEEKNESIEEIKQDLPEGVSMEEIDETEEIEEIEDDESDIPEYDDSMLKKELIKIAEDNNVELESNDTKADIISKLDEKFGK